MAAEISQLSIAAVILFFYTSARAQCWKDESLSPSERYVCYLDAHLCDEDQPSECLRETSYLATRSDGRQVLVRGVFSWYNAELIQDMEHPHFLLEYMRLLRNAYAADPGTYLTQLYNQIDYLISRVVERNGALVWENKYGIAQGMEQAEYAAYFASVAVAYRDNGESKLARGTMDYALRFIRALDMPAGEHTGGVASGEFYGGPMTARFRPCCWYHSRGLGVDLPGVQTVLNQHLHVIRDVLNLYLIVMDAHDLVSPEFGTPEEVLTRLEDRAIAGLYQLAFSAGNTSVQRSRPPNITQFMHYRENMTIKPSTLYPDGNPLDYYWCYYAVDMATGQGTDVGHKNTCHYHTHVLEFVAGIQDLLDRNVCFVETADGWHLCEAMDALLQGRGEATGMPGSVNAIYQFYQSEGPAYKDRRQGCQYDEVLSDFAHSIYRPLFE